MNNMKRDYPQAASTLIIQLFFCVLITFYDTRTHKISLGANIPHFVVIIIIILAFLTSIYAMYVIKNQKNVLPDNKYNFQISVCWFVVLVLRSIDILRKLFKP